MFSTRTGPRATLGWDPVGLDRNDRHQITVTTKKTSTWNVAGENFDVEKKAGYRNGCDGADRLKMDVLGVSEMGWVNS